MGAIYRQSFIRKLADGTFKRYTSNVYLCRFYANGRPWRFSTGLKDPHQAQHLCDQWEQQTKAGQPLDPTPPGKAKQRSDGGKIGGGMIDSSQDMSLAKELVYKIQLSRRRGLPDEAILKAVEDHLLDLGST